MLGRRWEIGICCDRGHLGTEWIGVHGGMSKLAGNNEGVCYRRCRPRLSVGPGKGGS